MGGGSKAPPRAAPRTQPRLAALLAALAAAVSLLSAAAAAPDAAPPVTAAWGAFDMGSGLAATREWVLNARAARGSSGGGGASGGAAWPRPRRFKPEVVIPLPGGFGYINATNFDRPVTAPTGCSGDTDTDRSCGSPKSYDPIRYVATMEELVRPKGYPLEAHTAVTPDGYNLALYRIPHGKYRNTQSGPKPLVLLVHGITLASNCYTVNNANESMAFVLADAGFDVWMANTRGNTYSWTHQTLSQHDTAFWRFSIDELALVDIPTTIDYMLATTGAKKTAYVGHSQGCTLALALLSARPEYNEKISVVAHMGPVVFVDDVAAPFLRFAGSASLDQILIDLNVPEFIPTRLTSTLAGNICDVYPPDELCAALLAVVFFGPSLFITPDDYLTITRTWPSGVGARNLEHWAQQLREKGPRFSQYNFGTLCNRTKWSPGHGLIPCPLRESCNQAEYGSKTPPQYDLSKITAPQAFFLAEFDVLTLSQDVTEVYRRLSPGVVVAEFQYADYGHMDFVWDRNAKHHPDIADVFYRFSPGTY